MLLAIYEDELSQPPHRGDGTAGDRTTTSPAGEVPAAAPGVSAAAPAQDTLKTDIIEDSDADQDAQGGNAARDAQGPLRAPEWRRHRQSAVPTGIRGLQAIGLALLLKREENDFLLRQKEMELEHRRLDFEERHTTIAERKLTLKEERLKMEAQRQNSTEILQEISNKLDQLEKKLLAYTNKEAVSKESAQFFGLKYSSS
ncbi:hypothetical protein HPB51_011566 [Rhipicephalus microplus]|uniref:Uncharacterized protein n=1 Tax=Rhipicephalus microplus TaxID=6941 RepID=A0A9J6EP85_RHIMP|nr:hypothetical protein HPB51_011566 [Rhipicephalus microplus]